MNILKPMKLEDQLPLFSSKEAKNPQKFNLTGGWGTKLTARLTVDLTKLSIELASYGYGSEDFRLLPDASAKMVANAINDNFIRATQSLGGTGYSTHFEYKSPVCNVYTAVPQDSSSTTDGPEPAHHHHEAQAPATDTDEPAQEPQHRQKQKKAELAQQLQQARRVQRQVQQAEEEKARKKREKEKQLRLKRQRQQAEPYAPTYYSSPKPKDLDGPDL